MTPTKFWTPNNVARLLVLTLVLILLGQWVSMWFRATDSKLEKLREGARPHRRPSPSVATPQAPKETEKAVDMDDLLEGTAVPAAVRLTPVPFKQLSKKRCICPSSCLVALCDVYFPGAEALVGEQAAGGGGGGGGFTFKEPELTIHFTRCTECKVDSVSGRCVAAQEDTYHCRSAESRDVIDRVRRCTRDNKGVIAPRVFSVGNDPLPVKGLSPVLSLGGGDEGAAQDFFVCDELNVNRCTNKASSLEGKVLVQAARFVQQSHMATAGGGAPGSVSLVDLGVSDITLVKRFVTHVSNSYGKQLSLRHDSYALGKLQECVSGQSSRISLSSAFKIRDAPVITPARPDSTFNFLRLYAPGYEPEIQRVLEKTLKLPQVSHPLMITTHTTRGEGTEKMTEFLVNKGYVGFQPSSCIEIQSRSDLSQLREWVRPMPGLKPEGLIAWVPAKNTEIFRPQCDSACLITECIDGWRTQYRRCPKSERCGPTHGGSCDWNISHTACKADSNWGQVLQCSEPQIVSPSWFSIVNAWNMLFACRGTKDCPRELDVPNVKRRIQELVGIVGSLGSADAEGNSAAPHVLDVGSGSGLVPLLVAKETNVKMHYLEGKPANRQLAKISSCFSKLDNFELLDLTNPSANMQPLDSVLADWKAGASPSVTQKERESKRIPLLVHIAAADPTPIVESAKQWLQDPVWSPAVILLSVPRRGVYFSKPASVWALLVQQGNYTAKKFNLEGSGGGQRSESFSSIKTRGTFIDCFATPEGGADLPAYKEPAEQDERHFEDTSVLVQFTHVDLERGRDD